MQPAEVQIAGRDFREVGSLHFIDIANDLAGDAHDDLVRGHDGSRRQHRAGRDETSRTNLTIIQHDGADADERATADAAAMHDGAVADADVVFDVHRHASIGVQHGAILNVAASTDGDGGDIAANDDVVHDGAVVAEGDLAADVGRGGDIDVFAETNAVGQINEIELHGREDSMS